LFHETLNICKNKTIKQTNKQTNKKNPNKQKQQPQKKPHRHDNEWFLFSGGSRNFERGGGAPEKS
jgi:hypothetical protein